MSVLILVLAGTISPAVSAAAEGVDREAVNELHDALSDAKNHGDPIEGDISEEALIEEIESTGLELQAGDGCSTPDATKALTKKYVKIFLSACNKHDVCY